MVRINANTEVDKVKNKILKIFDKLTENSFEYVEPILKKCIKSVDLDDDELNTLDDVVNACNDTNELNEVLELLQTLVISQSLSSKRKKVKVIGDELFDKCLVELLYGDEDNEPGIMFVLDLISTEGKNKLHYDKMKSLIENMRFANELNSSFYW